MDRMPRTQAEALAAALGVSVEQARNIQARSNAVDPRLALVQAYEDAQRAADFASAESAAWQAVGDVDISDAAASDDPEATLRAIVDDDTERIYTGIRASRLTAKERSLRASIAAHESWANTTDPTARTEPGRRAFADSFEAKVDPDGRLDPAERRRRAEHARKAHYKRMALKSAKVRRAKAAARRPPSEPSPT